MEHTLKIQEKFYVQIWNGKKTFELRKNDRDFKVGDTIQFKVLCLGYERDEKLKLEITGVFEEKGFGLEEGFCILSFKIL